MSLRKTLLIAGILLVAVVLTACFRCKYEKTYELGQFPEVVTNFEAINTEYDDYNSTVPLKINLNFPLMFSTNRATKGGTFDLIDYSVVIKFDQTTGDFSLGAFQTFSPYYYLTDLANSAADEYGPINGIYGDGSDEYLFCFASNRVDRNNMEIYVSYWDETTFTGGSPYQPDPFRLEGVNSSKYDAYPSFTADFTKMIICSNRDGELDFYTFDLPQANKVYGWIKETDTTYTATPAEVLNSPAKDACPWINNEVIVFASNREGGYGGYDLYYAEVRADGFGEPVNFGPTINTEHNEYRPVIMYAYSFENDLMIFSSDRPGGQGGYDLYWVGVERKTL